MGRKADTGPDPDAAPDTDGAQDSRQIGHYFDQTVFDLHYTVMMARARRLALEAELAAQGIVIDPDTGTVRVTPPEAEPDPAAETPEKP